MYRYEFKALARLVRNLEYPIGKRELAVQLATFCRNLAGWRFNEHKFLRECYDEGSMPKGATVIESRGEVGGSE